MYTAKVKHKTIIPENLKYWQIFSQDQQIYHFMNNEGEFQNCKIDTDCTIDQDLDTEIDLNNVDLNKLEFARSTKFSQSDIDKLEKVEIDEIIDEESDILNLKDNFLPKGLTPLEDFLTEMMLLENPKWSHLHLILRNAT